MHIHILGICGTFMGGVALLARALGHEVSGSDANVYPPMSTQLEQQGIQLMPGFDPAHLQPAPDYVVIGNALSRGNPAVEYVLNEGLPYTSGPQWLAEHILQGRWVLGVAGTHGKTSTASMLAWILEDNGLCPGFLIGGIPGNFGISARLGETPFFVVEADEYDTAFFDKRSKFVHYQPRTLILNNLEFDHADIFTDLAAIQTQFHHLIRTVPGTGLIITHDKDASLNEVLAAGCWTPVEKFGADSDWSVQNVAEDTRCFDIQFRQQPQGSVAWPLIGMHNVNNALAAVAAARHAGVPVHLACTSLHDFKGIKRRMEIRGEVNRITIYDDFAHHPTAIASTLNGLRRDVAQARILAILEPRSNTMRMGVHARSLGPALKDADKSYIYCPDDLSWDTSDLQQQLGPSGQLLNSVEAIIRAVVTEARPGDHILIMSNGGFDNIHIRLLEALRQADTQQVSQHVG